ncbi:MAG: FIST N-terminal domain-containing protein [Bauldia sp.]
MRANLLSWRKDSGWSETDKLTGVPQLLFYFGARLDLESADRYDELRARFPEVHLVGCSTGGQIRDDEVFDDQIAAVALSFDRTRLRVVHEEAESADKSFACGAAIGAKLAGSDLAGIFVLSDGLNVNGSALVDGIASIVGHGIPLTGGLAGDGDAFRATVVGADFAPRAHVVAAVGFYGNAVRIGHGSAGGWDQFGPRRRVTRSVGNVLYELDGEPALDLYERYLGDDAKGLPSTALLFPLRVYEPTRPDHDIVRTILAVDHEARSMTFAGDVPEGWVAQLMRGNFDRLAAGAAQAAHDAQEQLDALTHGGDELALLVSCIGRRLLMGQNTVDEVEAAGAELGDQVKRLGFYSYGEISPHRISGVSQLHNQTMTITTISEAA